MSGTNGFGVSTGTGAACLGSLSTATVGVSAGTTVKSRAGVVHNKSDATEGWAVSADEDASTEDARAAGVRIDGAMIEGAVITAGMIFAVVLAVTGPQQLAASTK